MASAFLEIQREKLMEPIEKTQRETEDFKIFKEVRKRNKVRDEKAVVKIQSLVRGFLIRRKMHYDISKFKFYKKLNPCVLMIQKFMRRFLATKYVENTRKRRKTEDCLLKVKKTVAAFKIMNSLRKYCTLKRSVITRKKAVTVKRRVVLLTDNSMHSSVIGLDSHSTLDVRMSYIKDHRKVNSSKHRSFEKINRITKLDFTPSKEVRLISSSLSKFQPVYRYPPLYEKTPDQNQNQHNSESESSLSDSGPIDYLKDIKPRYLQPVNKSKQIIDHRLTPQRRYIKPISNDKYVRLTISPNQIQIQAPELHSRSFTGSSLSSSKKKLPYRHELAKTPDLVSRSLVHQEFIPGNKLTHVSIYSPESGKTLFTSQYRDYMEFDSLDVNRRSYSRQIQRQALFQKNISHKYVNYRKITKFS